MTRPAFTAHNGMVRDRLGTDWTPEQATARMHLIADLLIEDDGFAHDCGVNRLSQLAAAIREARAAQPQHMERAA